MRAGDTAAMAPPFGQTTLGRFYLESRRPQEALAAFRAALALALAPESDDAHCNVGVLLQQLGRPDEALKAYDEAIRLQPANVIAHFNRGIVLRLANRLDEAAAAFATAAALGGAHGLGRPSVLTQARRVGRMATVGWGGDSRQRRRRPSLA